MFRIDHLSEFSYDIIYILQNLYYIINNKYLLCCKKHIFHINCQHANGKAISCCLLANIH